MNIILQINNTFLNCIYYAASNGAMILNYELKSVIGSGHGLL
jgi:hypothetical protein